MRRLVWLWGPVALYLGLIFLLSSLSHPLGPIQLGHLDKVAHFSEYAMLGALLARGLSGTLNRRWPWYGFAILAAALAAFYGLTDEFHQRFTPGRDPSLWDATADALGALTGAGLWMRVCRRLAREGGPCYIPERDG